MRRMNLVFLVALAAFLMPPAGAIEPKTAESLREVCADALDDLESDASQLCVAYVRGFLDGAVATDGRVADNVTREIEEEETFTKRAIRTRVINRLETYGDSVYAEFCIGQPDPIIDVVQHVIEEFDEYDDLEGVQAQSVVYRSLRRHYPCEAE